MNKPESFKNIDDTMSNRLFDCYRIALDFGLDIDNLAENLITQEKQIMNLTKDRSS